MDTSAVSSTSPSDESGSGVGVLDKAAAVLGALESGPQTLAQLVTILTWHVQPPTAWPHSGLTGSWLATCKAVLFWDHAWVNSPLPPEKSPACRRHTPCSWRCVTPASHRLFRRQGDQRICVAAASAPWACATRFRWATLSMKAGSTAQVLLAWEARSPAQPPVPASPPSIFPLHAAAAGLSPLESASRCCVHLCPGPQALEPIIAAVSISGPIERMGHQPGRIKPRHCREALTRYFKPPRTLPSQHVVVRGRGFCSFNRRGNRSQDR